MKMPRSPLEAIFAMTVVCLMGSVSLIIAKHVEKTPVKYISPFEVMEKEGGYRAGDDLLVRVHFCLLGEEAYYKSITQIIVPVEGDTDPLFIAPILGLTVKKDNWTENGRIYTDEQGYECFQAFGTPKKLPIYMPPGEYKLTFHAIVKGRLRDDHHIDYETVPFTIVE